MCFQSDEVAKPLCLCASRHIGLLRVKGRKMNLEKIPLKTVRQFFIEDVVLADYHDLFTPDTPQVTKKVEDLCFAKVTLKVPSKHTEPILHLLLSRLALLSPLCLSLSLSVIL